MPRRNDGLPSERDHSIYSTRQRSIVLSFGSREMATAFDELTDDELLDGIAYAVLVHNERQHS